MIIDPSISYARENFPRFVRELKDFVRFPSVSAQPQHADDVRECARWLGAHLKQIGVEQVQIVATKGHPVVLGQWCHLPGQATLLIYGHYMYSQRSRWRSGAHRHSSPRHMAIISTVVERAMTKDSCSPTSRPSKPACALGERCRSM